MMRCMPAAHGIFGDLMKQMRVRYKISADLIERNQFMCYSLTLCS